jgi:hypothetical protein
MRAAEETGVAGETFFNLKQTVENGRVELLNRSDCEPLKTRADTWPGAGQNSYEVKQTDENGRLKLINISSSWKRLKTIAPEIGSFRSLVLLFLLLSLLLLLVASSPSQLSTKYSLITPTSGKAELLGLASGGKPKEKRAVEVGVAGETSFEADENGKVLPLKRLATRVDHWPGFQVPDGIDLYMSNRKQEEVKNLLGEYLKEKN